MTDFLRRYTLVSYLVALMFIVLSVLDAATNAWPWFFSSEQWRFGSTGIVSGYLVSVIFGLLLMSAVAVGRKQRGMLYVVSVTATLLTLFLLALIISYALDTFQVRNVVREDQLEMFKIGAAKTAFKIGLSLAVTMVLAFASYQAAKDAGGSTSRA
mgnify:CR=1 FL=1